MPTVKGGGVDVQRVSEYNLSDARRASHFVLPLLWLLPVLTLTGTTSTPDKPAENGI